LSVYILVVDDEPDVEALFRQQFRRDIRSGRFMMEFATSAQAALARAADIVDPPLILTCPTSTPPTTGACFDDASFLKSGMRHWMNVWRLMRGLPAEESLEDAIGAMLQHQRPRASVRKAPA
jgi:hypothetical protein